MNIQSILPAIAAIAYIPLFIILVLHRPWGKRQKLLFLVLLSAMFWSSSDFFLRSDFFLSDKLLLFRIVICSFGWMFIQLFYFINFLVRNSEDYVVWVSYGVLALYITLVLVGYIPLSVAYDSGVVAAVFDWHYYVILPFFPVLGGVIVYRLIKKMKYSYSPVESNSLFYVLAAVITLVVFFIPDFTPIGEHYPFSHIGNLFTACILTYAVVKKDILSMKIVFQYGLGRISLAGLGVGFYLLLLYSLNAIFHYQIEFSAWILTTFAAFIVGVAIFRYRGRFYSMLGHVFYRESYAYREQLLNFVQHETKGMFSLDELGNRLVVLFTGSLNCKQIHLLLPHIRENDFIAEFTGSTSEGNERLQIRQDSYILEWLKRNRKYLTIENVFILPEFRGLWEEEKRQLRNWDIRYFFPMVSRGNLIGILALGKRDSGEYNLEEIEMVENIIAQISVSLEKEYLQDKLKKQEQELALINRLTMVMTSSLDIRKIYDTFAAELGDVVSVDFAIVSLIDGDELYLEALATSLDTEWQVGERMPLGNSATEWVAKQRRYLYNSDLNKIKKDNEFSSNEKYRRMGVQSILYLPLLVRKEAIGSLIIASRRPDAYNHEQIGLLERLSRQIALPIENSRLYNKAEQRARVDELTGLFNRRHFDESLKQEIDRHSRYKGILSLVLLDLDFFKNYNDTYGHLAGDVLLGQIGKLMERLVRKVDIVFRYGGDEFVILLPQALPDDALVVAERVREGIVTEMEERQISVTASLGIACWPSDGITPDEVINVADRALYYAKQTGGNRTYFASKLLSFAPQPVVLKAANTEKETLNTIYALAATIEARDAYTYGHSRKVRGYAVALAEALGLTSEKVAIIDTAALLHDIGKIGIPDDVLNKAGALNPEEWELIKSHPQLSATIIGHVPNLIPCLHGILHHHERWDGTGYPSGLKSENIPLEARILCIADAFDAMTSPRPYRDSMSNQEAVDQLKSCAGSQFDSELVEAFLPIALAAAPEELGVGENPGSSKTDL